MVATIEISAKHPAQFIVGRIIVYMAVGTVECVVPAYQAEVVPASMRAWVVASQTFFVQIGGLIAFGVNDHYKGGTTEASWQIPIGLTYVFPTLILFFLPFMPSSPRWLVFKGRHEEAIKALKRIRPAEDVARGVCEEEIAALQASHDEQEEGKKLPWKALLGRRHLRRTAICWILGPLQQFTGQAFNSQYSTTFYTLFGLSQHQAFEYPLISQSLTVIAAFANMFFLDQFGRRPVFIYGALGMAFWMFLMGGIGLNKHPSTSQSNAVIAATILYPIVYNASWGGAMFAALTEIPSGVVSAESRHV